MLKTSLKWLSDHKRSLACNFWLCSLQYLWFLSYCRIFLFSLFSDTLWDSLRTIQTHLDSFRLIQTHSDLFRLIQAHWALLRLIETHGDALEGYWGKGPFWLGWWWDDDEESYLKALLAEGLLNWVYFYATKVAGRSKLRILVKLGWVDQLMGRVHHAKYFWPGTTLILIRAHPNFQVSKKN